MILFSACNKQPVTIKPKHPVQKRRQQQDDDDDDEDDDLPVEKVKIL